MPQTASAGALFRAALAEEKPLQIVGVINAYAALLAEQAGFRALYLSGGGVAASRWACPTWALPPWKMCWSMRAASPTLPRSRCWWTWTPALAAPSILPARCARWSSVGAAGAAHRRPGAGQALRSPPGQGIGVQSGDGRPHQGCRGCAHRPHFGIMARTDALAVEGLQAALERAGAYVEAGADMIFAEAVTDPPMYAQFSRAAGVPILANMTEFGKIPAAHHH